MRGADRSFDKDVRMKISRIFRKYSRVLLLVFMSVLLVVFLIGDAISSSTRGSDRQDFELGQAFGEPLLASYIQRAQLDVQTAQTLRFRAPLVLGLESGGQDLAQYLLIEEARRAGVIISPQHVIEALKQNPDFANMALDQLRRDGRGLDSIYDSVCRVLAVSEYAQYQYAAATGVSLPELEEMYRNENQDARVLVSTIDANAFLDKVPEPTEEEIQAYFEECKNRDSASTDEERVDGYRVGDRISVEYLTVDPKAIEEQIRITSREVQRYYEDNKQRYMKEVEGSQFSLEQNPQPQRIQMTLEEANDQVRRDCRADKAVTEAQRLMNLIQQEARRPWDTAPMGEGNQRQVPAPETQVSFEELRDRHSDEYPVTYLKTDLKTERELQFLPGFGRASTRLSGNKTITAGQYAFHVEGLADEAETPQNLQNVPVLHLNEPSPLMINLTPTRRTAQAPSSQAYMFRVVEVKPAGPPDSIEDVRDRVVSDLKKKRAFEMAQTQAKALADHAKEIGLKEAVEAAEELRTLLTPVTPEPVEGEETPNAEALAKQAERYLNSLKPTEPAAFKRMPGPNTVGSPTLHEKIFESPANGGPDTSLPHPVIEVPNARGMRCFVAELEEIKPVYQGDFDAARAQLEQDATQSQAQFFFYTWFNVKNIEARTGYMPKLGTEASEE